MNFVVTLLFSHFASKLETANERIMYLDFVHRPMFSHKTQLFGNGMFPSSSKMKVALTLLDPLEKLASITGYSKAFLNIVKLTHHILMTPTKNGNNNMFTHL
jgi:hypothetical protein